MKKVSIMCLNHYNILLLKLLLVTCLLSFCTNTFFSSTLEVLTLCLSYQSGSFLSNSQNTIIREYSFIPKSPRYFFGGAMIVYSKIKNYFKSLIYHSYWNYYEVLLIFRWSRRQSLLKLELSKFENWIFPNMKFECFSVVFKIFLDEYCLQLKKEDEVHFLCNNE